MDRHIEKAMEERGQGQTQGDETCGPEISPNPSRAETSNHCLLALPGVICYKHDLNPAMKGLDNENSPYAFMTVLVDSIGGVRCYREDCERQVRDGSQKPRHQQCRGGQPIVAGDNAGSPHSQRCRRF
ncbi:hypothetical protein RRG08_058727 [Elysia crispata]|uniref:Uncharacterized protein n=1 Tax=Elysia crispata TaxID=231223 RepID=A0AAE0YYA1_9GAST|nr:hypothetical protein RRG08_058727 [Elysia crispata]